MGGWTGCPASVGSLPRPLGEKTLRATWFSRLKSLTMQWMLPTPASTVTVGIKNVKKKKKGRGSGSACGCGTLKMCWKQLPWLWYDCNNALLAITMPAQLLKQRKKIEKEHWESSCVVDLPYRKYWGDNKYSNDSSVPLHPQLKLTRGPNVECQQQAQRSGLWGAEAAIAQRG